MNSLLARVEAELLVKKHLGLEWRVRYDYSTKRLGYCSHNTKSIVLSKSLISLNSRSVIKNATLHEVAHAMAGDKHGHSRVWELIAKSIGCDAKTRFGKDVVQPKAKWVPACKTCGHEFQASSKANNKSACVYCCNMYNDGIYSTRFLLTWREV